MKNAQIIFTPTEDVHKMEVWIMGDLTIQNIPDIWDQILRQTENHSSVEVIVNEVSAIDLAFYQLMLSMEKTIRSSSRQFNVAYNLPEDFQKIFANSGINL